MNKLRSMLLSLSFLIFISSSADAAETAPEKTEDDTGNESSDKLQKIQTGSVPGNDEELPQLKIDEKAADNERENETAFSDSPDSCQSAKEISAEKTSDECSETAEFLNCTADKNDPKEIPSYKPGNKTKRKSFAIKTAVLVCAALAALISGLAFFLIRKKGI